MEKEQLVAKAIANFHDAVNGNGEYYCTEEGVKQHTIYKFNKRLDIEFVLSRATRDGEPYNVEFYLIERKTGKENGTQNAWFDTDEALAQEITTYYKMFS